PRTPTTRWNQRSERLPSWWPIGAGNAGRRTQILLRDRASADFLLAAWFLWMTPLVAALSSLRLVDTSNSVAFSLSPASAASRNARTAVRSDDFTDLLRRRARSLVRLRFCCDLMLATRSSFVKSQRLVGVTVCRSAISRLSGDCLGYQSRMHSPKATRV